MIIPGIKLFLSLASIPRIFGGLGGSVSNPGTPSDVEWSTDSVTWNADPVIWTS